MSRCALTLFLAIAAATAVWAQPNTYSITTADGGGLEFTYSASGINNSGQIVGTQHDSLPEDCGNVRPCSFAFLYSGGAFGFAGGSFGAAINNSGQVAGFSYYNDLLNQYEDTQAFVYSGGASTLLPFLPGGADSQATGINDSGQVVGWSATASGKNEAFLYSGGVMTGLLPGYVASVANGINNSGQIVGAVTDSSGHTQAFLYSGGVMTGLGTLPGYAWSAATAINNKGQIVGYAVDASGQKEEAFLYSGGVMTGLGAPPGYTNSAATAINNRGQIVGSAPEFGVPPFLYSAGQMCDLNTLVANAPTPLGWASGINDSGQIVATGWGDVYLLTPLPWRFVPVTPCRVVDTRTSAGPLGGPALDGVSARSFHIQGACGIPATAQAYSLNVTAVPQGPLGYLTVWPAGMAQPGVSTLNSWEGNVVANAALVSAGQNGAVSVFANSPTDVVLDIDGYFDTTAGDSFYPVTPCRVADTRNPANPLSGGETRDFAVLPTSCGLPVTATAYSMNVTAVPSARFLSFLTTWAAGQPQPAVSTLNSWNGTVVANAAIVPAGADGATSVYVTNPSDVILDVNGYFAPSGGAGALTYYPLAPCRVVDTRGAQGPFGGPKMEAQTTRSFALPAGGCSAPSTAAAYSLNVTVVPDGPLSFLTAWPTGVGRRVVSTLNSFDGAVVANAAIVPAGTNGAISIYVTDRTQVILDINGYFAP